MRTHGIKAHVRPPEARCGHCGALSAGREGKQYCSKKCRAAASRERRARHYRELEGRIAELAMLANRQP